MASTTTYGNPTFQGGDGGGQQSMDVDPNDAGVSDENRETPAEFDGGSSVGEPEQSGGSTAQLLSETSIKAARPDASKASSSPVARPSALEILSALEVLGVVSQVLKSVDHEDTGYIKIQDVLDKLAAPTPQGDCKGDQASPRKASSLTSLPALQTEVPEVQRHSNTRKNSLQESKVFARNQYKRGTLRPSVLNKHATTKALQNVGQGMKRLRLVIMLATLAVVLFLAAMFAVNVMSIEFSKEMSVKNGNIMVAGSDGDKREQPLGTTPTYTSLDPDEADVREGRSEPSRLTLEYFASVREIEYSDVESMWMRVSIQAQAVLPCPVDVNHTLSFYCVDLDNNRALFLLSGIRDEFAAVVDENSQVKFLKIYDNHFLESAREHVDMPMQRHLLAGGGRSLAIFQWNSGTISTAVGVGSSAAGVAVCASAAVLTLGIGGVACGLGFVAASTAAALITGSLWDDDDTAQEQLEQCNYQVAGLSHILGGNQCPPGYTVAKAHQLYYCPGGGICCIAGWEANCGEVCKRAYCHSVYGRWNYAPGGYNSRPYSCELGTPPAKVALPTGTAYTYGMKAGWCTAAANSATEPTRVSTNNGWAFPLCKLTCDNDANCKAFTYFDSSASNHKGCIIYHLTPVSATGYDANQLPARYYCYEKHPGQDTALMLHTGLVANTGKWKLRQGYYVADAGHGSAAECYDFETAVSKCAAAADCHAIAHQNNVGTNPNWWRVTHGASLPNFGLTYYGNAYQIHSYELDRSTVP